MDGDSHWPLSHSSDRKNCLNCLPFPIIIVDGKFIFKSISDSTEQDSSESIYEIIRPAESESDFEVCNSQFCCLGQSLHGARVRVSVVTVSQSVVSWPGPYLARSQGLISITIFRKFRKRVTSVLITLAPLPPRFPTPICPRSRKPRAGR